MTPEQLAEIETRMKAVGFHIWADVDITLLDKADADFLEHAWDDIAALLKYVSDLQNDIYMLKLIDSTDEIGE